MGLTDRRAGILLCLVSGASFGAMAIFAKLAFGDGATVIGTLAIRFALAAAVCWALVTVVSPPAAARRDVLAALGLGAAFYSAQSALFFSSLTRIGASLAALLLYAFPAIVTVVAVLGGRERADRRRVIALVAASTGVALVLLGAGGAGFDALGAALALGAACVYAAYLLIADRLLTRVHPLRLAALVFTGAALSYAIAGLASGRLALDLGPTGWSAIVAMALVSTVLAATASYAGLRRVGPTTTSIVSTVEPPVTVLLAFLVFGEQLTAVQLGGGALVLGAVLLLAAPVHARAAHRVRARGAAALTARRTAARPLGG